jgi:IclR family transcriptional regulator, KDG regulon repressor
LQSLQRASDILDIFIQEDKQLGLAEIVKRIDLPKSTVQGLLYSLEALSYLEQDTVTYKYKLGPKLFHLGMKYITNNDVFAIAQVWMERLSYKYNEAVNVGMLIDDKVVVVMRVEPDKKFMSYPRVGTVIPAHSSSMGKTLLAHLDKDHQRKILKDYVFTQYTEYTIDNLDDFLDELKTVKENGISFDNQESALGLSCIGTGVFNQKGEILVAFTVTGKADHVKEEEEDIIESIRQTSHQLSRQLGYIGSIE